jgi:predicted cupin superfamily sugar epimerase
MSRKDLLIKELNMEPHVEGGYFVQTYATSENTTIVKDDGRHSQRPLMTVIHYLLTSDSPYGHFHRNRSDVVHFYNLGLSLKYHVITPEGNISSVVLGPNIEAGEKPQLMVKGGCWKATEIIRDEELESKGYDFGLLSESVSPGFDYADWAIATADDIKALLPKAWKSWERFIQDKTSLD